MSAAQPHRAFEWDETKRLKNIEKHGFDFFRAISVLLAANVDVPSTFVNEPRRKATGMLDGKLVTVIYTRRPGGTRIISVRRARTNERKTYRELYG